MNIAQHFPIVCPYGYKGGYRKYEHLKQGCDCHFHYVTENFVAITRGAYGYRHCICYKYGFHFHSTITIVIQAKHSVTTTDGYVAKLPNKWNIMVAFSWHAKTHTKYPHEATATTMLHSCAQKFTGATAWSLSMPHSCNLAKQKHDDSNHAKPTVKTHIKTHKHVKHWNMLEILFDYGYYVHCMLHPRKGEALKM